MDRRTFLKTTTAAAAATTASAGAVHGAASRPAPAHEALAAPSIVQHRHELQIAVSPEPHLTDAASEILRDIAQASAGRLVFQLSSNARPTASAIADGTFDGAVGNLSQICDMPALSVFSGMPGDAPSSSEGLLNWYAAAAGDMYLDECAAEFGLTAMITDHTGSNPGLWASRRLTDLQDFAAASIETIGIAPSVIAEIRSNSGIAFGEGTSLPSWTPTGLLPAAILADVPAAAVTALSIIPPEHRRVWFADGIHNAGHASMLVFTRQVWEQLADGDKIVVRAITTAATHRAIARADTNRALLQRQLFTNAGITTLPLPADIKRALHEGSHDISADIIARAPIAVRRAHQALAGFRRAFVEPGRKPATRNNHIS